MEVLVNQFDDLEKIVTRLAHQGSVRSPSFNTFLEGLPVQYPRAKVNHSSKNPGLIDCGCLIFPTDTITISRHVPDNNFLYPRLNSIIESAMIPHASKPPPWLQDSGRLTESCLAIGHVERRAKCHDVKGL